MTRRDARCASNAVRGGTGEGGNIQESIPGVSRFRTEEPEGGKLRVHYARDAWRTNGLRIRIRLVVLSNFHLQSFSIRATVYFILILKD